MSGKPIALALGYDSYSVVGESKSLVFAFESPPLARAAFREHLARARKQKRLAVVDATRIPPALASHAERLQLEWDGDLVRRAWFTAQEGGEVVADPLASELVAVALELRELARVAEIGIGLPRWQDSHRGAFDDVLDVLERRRPPLTALAFGDHANPGGHVLRLDDPSRIAGLYPQLTRLRLTCTKLPRVPELAALEALWLRGVTRDDEAFAALDRPWPALAWLGVGWRFGASPKERVADWDWLLAGERTPALRHLILGSTKIFGSLVGALARSRVLPRLATLELRELDQTELVVKNLRASADAFRHLEQLWLPGSCKVPELEAAGVRVRYREDRFAMIQE